ncbi:MAG TPA: HD domain-containing phosphohydrolase [bacterium]
MNPYTVLVVDDEPDIVQLLEEAFSEAGFRVLTALSARQALALLDSQKPDVIISDNRMPEISGIEFLEMARLQHRDVVRFLMTGYADLQIAIDAINRGYVYQFITKPFKMEEILVAVRRAMEYYEIVRQKMVLEQQIREQNVALEQRVQDRTRELQELSQELVQKNVKLLRQKNQIRRLFSQLQRSYLGTIAAMFFALESRDQFSRGHSERVLHYALSLGKKLELSPSEMLNLKYAALLHDLGKIGIPEALLLKNGRLTDEEFAIVKGHPEIGAALLDPIQFLSSTRDIIRHHHERYDGKGYPDGLIGEGIDIKGRIIAVVDAYDAMRSDRPYRLARSRKAALEELKQLTGQQFCPRCVKVMTEVLDEIGDFYDNPELLENHRDDLRFIEEDMRGVNEILSLHSLENFIG